MPEPATDDRAAAYLADARRRWEAFGEADSLPALLGAVEALLKPHQPGRIALTGRKATPPVIETMVVLGRACVSQRLRAAAELLKVYRPVAPV